MYRIGSSLIGLSDLFTLRPRVEAPGRPGLTNGRPSPDSALTSGMPAYPIHGG